MTSYSGASAKLRPSRLDATGTALFRDRALGVPVEGALTRHDQVAVQQDDLVLAHAPSLHRRRVSGQEDGDVIVERRLVGAGPDNRIEVRVLPVGLAVAIDV